MGRDAGLTPVKGQGEGKASHGGSVLEKHQLGCQQVPSWSCSSGWAGALPGSGTAGTWEQPSGSMASAFMVKCTSHGCFPDRELSSTSAWPPHPARPSEKACALWAQGDMGHRSEEGRARDEIRMVQPGSPHPDTSNTCDRLSAQHVFLFLQSTGACLVPLPVLSTLRDGCSVAEEEP